MSNTLTVALIGNPNTGKSSIFNQLTGLSQKVGNYPGITVEKKEGQCKLPGGKRARIVDLPGLYSLNTSSMDERLVTELLLDPKDPNYPDVVVLISEVENLKRNLYLFTQIKDLGIPVLLAINMIDRMSRKGITLEVASLEKKLDTKIVLVSTRRGEGLDRLKEILADPASLPRGPIMDIGRVAPDYFGELKKAFPEEDLYRLWLSSSQDTNTTAVDLGALEALKSNFIKSEEDLKKLQHRETALRYQKINEALKGAYGVDPEKAKGLRASIDRILTHKVFGYLIFFALLLLIFQAIFEWSSYPMDFIDAQFAAASEWISENFPPGMLTDLLAEGIVAGIGGIVIFVPQIAFLFLFIALLEESGYMSRVVFLMDRLMRPFGLSGKSVVPLISGNACAIPAIMATRTIENWKERLITILVTPFTTCSARLPVYLILIALVIPEEGSFMGIGYQALTLLALYLIGTGMALLSALVLDKLLKTKGRTLFLLEMPAYRLPLLKNVGLTVWDKTMSFVLGAGKIILAISIVLWFLGSHGSSENFDRAEEIVGQRIEQQGLATGSLINLQVQLDSRREDALAQGLSQARLRDSLQLWTQELEQTAKAQEIAGYKLEHSYIGRAGKAIEPLVRPLGYDWKIGIALITSFAAREVFVGTLATIYSVGSEDEEPIKARMAADINEAGQPLFNLATGVSLMLFYAFAMQCMSTLAIVQRETNSWKWPLAQFVFMTILAYIVSFAAYQILS